MFIKNFLTLVSGGILAQIAPLLISPFITRLYTPVEFGVYGLFLSTNVILSAIASGSFHNASMVAKSFNQSKFLIYISIFMALLFCCLVSIVILLFGPHITSLLSSDDMLKGLYFLPISILLTCLSLIFYVWLNKHNAYSHMRNTRLIQSFLTSAIILLFGYLQLGVYGLIISYLFSQVISVLSYLHYLLKRRHLLPKVTFNKVFFLKLYTVFKKHTHFLFFSAPGDLLNSLSTNILFFCIELFFTPTYLGMYTLANRLIQAPLNLISKSFSSVFFERFNRKDTHPSLYLKSFLSSICTYFIALLPIYLYGDVLFEFFFGPKWALAGEVAQALCPVILLTSSMACVETVFASIKRNEFYLLWQFSRLSTSIIVLTFFHTNFLQTISLFSYSAMTVNLTFFFIGFFLVRKHHLQKENFSTT